MSSLCTAKALREYFVAGKLPEGDLLCSTDEVLFPPKSASITDESLTWLESNRLLYSEDDLKLLKAMRELGIELANFASTFKKPRLLF